MMKFLFAHRREIEAAFVLYGGLFVVYAWLKLTEVHTCVTQMFEEVYEEEKG